MGEHEAHMSGKFAKPKAKVMVAKEHKSHTWPCLTVLPCVGILESVLLDLVGIGVVTRLHGIQAVCFGAINSALGICKAASRREKNSRPRRWLTYLDLQNKSHDGVFAERDGQNGKVGCNQDQ